MVVLGGGLLESRGLLTFFLDADVFLTYFVIYQDLRVLPKPKIVCHSLLLERKFFN